MSWPTIWYLVHNADDHLQCILGVHNAWYESSQFPDVRPPQSEFNIALWNVVYYGEALQLLAGDVAIQRHLQVIEDKLMDFHHKWARDVANQATTLTLPDVEELGEANPENDDDEELQSVQPFANRALPMWKSAKDRLKLMVVHFDVIKIINAYYREANLKMLTIKILLGPKINTTMLTWKGLLQDEKYIKPINNFNPYHIPTSEEISRGSVRQPGSQEGYFYDTRTAEESWWIDSIKWLQGSLPRWPYDFGDKFIRLEGWHVVWPRQINWVHQEQDKLTECIRSKIEELRDIDDESPKSPGSIFCTALPRCLNPCTKAPCSIRS